MKDGIVTLTGHLDTYAEKEAATRVVRRVAGFKGLAVDLEVKLSPTHKRSDTDIAASAELALKWNTSVPIDAVRIKVENGWVILQGEVEWNVQRHSAEMAIRPLMGVVGISNEIRMRAKPRVADLTLKIQDALKRQALREAQRIHIAIDGNTVTLTGHVHSWQERDAAQGVAWSAPGIRAVVNELQVA